MDVIRLQCGRCEHTFQVSLDASKEGADEASREAAPDRKTIHKCPACGKLVMIAGTGDDMAISGAYPIASRLDPAEPEPEPTAPTEGIPPSLARQLAEDPVVPNVRIAAAPSTVSTILAMVLVIVAAGSVFWVIRDQAPPPSPVDAASLQVAVDTLTFEDRDGVLVARLQTLPGGADTNRGAVDLCRAVQEKAGRPGGRVTVTRPEGSVVVRCDGTIARLEQ